MMRRLTDHETRGLSLLGFCLGLCGWLIGTGGNLTADEINVPASPQWIWAEDSQDGDAPVVLRRKFSVEGPVQSAWLQGTTEACEARISVNGEKVAYLEPFDSPFRIEVTSHLQEEGNWLGILARGIEGPSALALRLELEYADGRRQTIVSGPDWEATTTTVAFGAVEPVAWEASGGEVAITPLDDYTQWKRAQNTDQTTDPGKIEAPPGFEVRRLRSALPDEGSWIALTFDPQGRLIVAKERVGLLRMTLPEEDTDELQVELVNDSLRECRGLLFAHGALYAMANEAKGLHRLRDSNGDDQFDEVTFLQGFEGPPGHGRNQLVLGPEGKLYCIFGDSISLLEDAKTLVPPLARPNPFERARHGFVARTDADGREWEILTAGLRNPYGITFGPDGELFTYDADAEYDMGSPWYRPTRMVHLTSGGDFGWREVTQQWPPYDPDRPDIPQPLLDIGHGSPTAVAYGQTSRFPSPYRQAVYALDWAYGRVLAIHLQPRGSGYRAQAEVFLRGSPLNVTDMAFGPDGAMYLVTGGRGTQSALYQIRSTGGEEPKTSDPTPQVTRRQEHSEQARALRRKLEGFHGRQDPQAIETAWPHLAHPDPWIRTAARTAIEWQPPDTWQGRALDETDPAIALAAWLAVLRVGPESAVPQIVDRLQALDWQSLTPSQRLTVLFLSKRAIEEQGLLPQKVVQGIAKTLDPHYPDSTPRVNWKLSELLAEFEPEGFVPRTMALLNQADSQQEQMHYLRVLSGVGSGWDDASRQTYFDHLVQMKTYTGGQGMPTFGQLIQTAALENVPEEQRPELAARLEPDQADDWWTAIADQTRPPVRDWKLEDFPELPIATTERDPDRGRKIFAEARCIACHRAEGRGGVLGPDLTSVSRRFSPRDVLTAILHPSRTVAENYRGHVFALEDGRVISGQILPGGDFRLPELSVITDPLDPDSVVRFSKEAIVEQKVSPTSPMPEGLLNCFTREEILDLLAYLSGAAR